MNTLVLLNIFLILVRILAVLMTAPVFNNRSIPTMIKFGLAALLALILWPVHGPDVGLNALPGDVFTLALVIGQEVLIGVLIGFVSNLVFVSISMAASMMSLQVGFRAANLFNPLAPGQSSALEQFYTLMAAGFFLSIDGHHLLLRALGRSLEAAPLGTFAFTGGTAAYLLHLITESFTAAISISLPVVGSLLLADLGLGLIARAVPQVQVFFLGLPLKMALGFIALAMTLSLSLPYISVLFRDIAGHVLTIISS